MFTKITPKAIRAAFDVAGQVDEHLVSASKRAACWTAS